MKERREREAERKKVAVCYLLFFFSWGEERKVEEERSKRVVFSCPTLYCARNEIRKKPPHIEEQRNNAQKRDPNWSNRLFDPVHGIYG